MTLTSEQVDAITHAWLDCCATSKLREGDGTDLDGLAEAAGDSAEELEQAFPFLVEGVDD
jgi:hypothetical protein